MGSILGWLLIAGVVQFIVGGLILLVIILAPILLLRSIFGGRSSRSSSSSSTAGGGLGSIGRRDFPTSFYTGSRRLSDFSINPDVYNFRTPTPTPNLEKLREPLEIDFSLAERLHLGRVGRLANQELDLDKARELFLPSIFSDVDEEDIEAS